MPLLLRPPLKQGGGWGFYTILFPFVSSPVILLHSFFFPSFSSSLFFEIVDGQALCCHLSQELGGGGPLGGPQPLPPYTPRTALSLLMFSETKLYVKFVVVNNISTNNCYNSTGTVCSLCFRYSTSGPDRSKNSSIILGRLISSGFFVSMNTARGVGHAQ